MFCHCHNWVPAQSIREGWPTLDLVEVHFSLPKNVREETCRFKAGENVLISINDPVSTSAARDGRVFNDHEHDNYEILSPDTDFKRKSKERRGRPAGPTQNQPTLASIDVYTCTMEQSIHIVYTEFTLTYMQLNAAGFPTNLYNGVAATFGRGARNLFSLAPTKILNMSRHTVPSYPRTCEEPKKKTVALQIKPSSCKSVHIHTTASDLSLFQPVGYIQVCLWSVRQSHVLKDKHRSSEYVQPTSSSHFNAGFLLDLDGKFFGMFTSIFLSKRPFFQSPIT